MTNEWFSWFLGSLLKGLLKPFKGKGGLEAWANQCTVLRDELIELAKRQVLSQARAHPFGQLRIQLAQQPTAAGTTFLRWRSLDHARMGVTLWEDVMGDPATPANLLDDLLALECQRVTLNMQISLVHTIARQAAICASKVEQAEAICLRRLLPLNAYSGNPVVSYVKKQGINGRISTRSRAE